MLRLNTNIEIKYIVNALKHQSGSTPLHGCSHLHADIVVSICKVRWKDRRQQTLFLPFIPSEAQNSPVTVWVCLNKTKRNKQEHTKSAPSLVFLQQILVLWTVEVDSGKVTSSNATRHLTKAALTDAEHFPDLLRKLRKESNRWESKNTTMTGCTVIGLGVKRLRTKTQTPLAADTPGRVSCLPARGEFFPGSLWRVTNWAAQQHRSPDPDDTDRTDPCRHTGKCTTRLLFQAGLHFEKSRSHFLTREDGAANRIPLQRASLQQEGSSTGQDTAGEPNISTRQKVKTPNGGFDQPCWGAGLCRNPSAPGKAAAGAAPREAWKADHEQAGRNRTHTGTPGLPGELCPAATGFPLPADILHLSEHKRFFLRCTILNTSKDFLSLNSPKTWNNYITSL